MTALFGAGGNGEGYRARDTKLNREVAITVLPEAFTTDPDRVACFQRPRADEGSSGGALARVHVEWGFVTGSKNGGGAARI